MADERIERKRKIADVTLGDAEQTPCTAPKVMNCVIELGDGSQLYRTPGNTADVAPVGQKTNTSLARRIWTFDPQNCFIMIPDDHQLCSSPNDWTGVLPGEKGMQGVSQTWTIDRQTGIISLADGQQLYKHPDGYAASGLAGSGSNTEEASRMWKIREVKAPVQCVIELQDGSQLHRAYDNYARVYPAGLGTNTSLYRRLWSFDPDGGIISIAKDYAYQLHNTPTDWACVSPVGEGTNTELARRTWKIDWQTGIISLGDRKQLYKHPDTASACLNFMGVGANTDESRRVWKICEFKATDLEELPSWTKVSIALTSLSGSTLVQLEVYEHETVSHLKMQVEHALKWPVAEQKLLLDTTTDLSDPNRAIGEYLGGRSQADVLMIRVYSEKVYFLGFAWGKSACGISARGLLEGNQLCNSNDGDLFKKIPKSGDTCAFEHVNNPGLYMGVDESCNLVLCRPNERREVFRQAAAWNGDSAKSSFESMQFPGCWIAHRWGRMHVRGNEGGYFYGDASWQLVE